MKKFSFKCTCGHVMSVEAAIREEGVAKMKAMMTQQALDDHMAQNHKPEDPKPTLE